MSRSIALALALSACGGSSSAPTIDGAEAHALVANGATLLDVRTPSEWSAGHVGGAVLVPIDELERRLAEIPRGRPVVVYCASGVRSARATAILRAAGYDARDLGGMSQWDG
jgi:phage shock protein E